MPYIPDVPILEKLRLMGERGTDNMGHPYFASQWMTAAREAAAEIERLCKALAEIADPNLALLASTKADIARAALQRIAEQKMQEEMEVDSSEVRWEEGYDALIQIAREALSR